LIIGLEAQRKVRMPIELTHETLRSSRASRQKITLNNAQQLLKGDPYWNGQFSERTPPPVPT
jgi:hypothetical protein